jgi:hypothetical protein
VNKTQKMDMNNNCSVFNALLDHDYAKASELISLDDCEKHDAERGDDENHDYAKASELISLDDSEKHDDEGNDKNNAENKTAESLLNIGRTFKSMVEVVGFMDDFMSQSKTAFVRKSCNKSQVYYECKHGTKRKQKCKKNARPIQHSIKFDCKAFVRFSRRVSGIIILTSYSLDHTTPSGQHLILDAIYHRENASFERAPHIDTRCREVQNLKIKRGWR